MPISVDSRIIAESSMRTIPITDASGRIWGALKYILISLGLMVLASIAIQARRDPSILAETSSLPSKQQEYSAGRDQAKEYSDDVPKTILELQQFRHTDSIHIRSSTGNNGVATLINLNPAIGRWYVLKVAWDGSPELSYHLENPVGLSRKLILDEQFPSGLVILEREKRYPCDLFGDRSKDALSQAATTQRIYAPLCGTLLYLRNPAKGQRTTLESATEFLRDQVWGGEKVIDLFHHLLDDSHRQTGKIQTVAPSGNTKAEYSSSLPLPALIDSQFADQIIAPGELGIPFEKAEKGGLRPGSWYPAGDNPGIYVSLLQPNFVSPLILQSYKKTVNSLDSTEASSLCYLVAFDLDKFDLSYALGTDHPGVRWSAHILAQMKNADLPGPDGIGSISPLVSTGLINPEDARMTVATFTGGFKREHGAFKYGDLAEKNHGSHYGFVQDGVMFSKLQPGLATIMVLDDGRIDLKTWEEKDNQLLARIKFARQNGVPLVEFDKASQSTVPGALVNRWGPGNWSGSEDLKLRTIRAGVALQETNGRRFLIYAVFSDATPSAMARIFQAYQCQYALLLDMNALEHTYLAVYRRSQSQFAIDHLIRGMSQVDKSSAGKVVPRFLGYPDNRDFFYVTRRNP